MNFKSIRSASNFYSNRFRLHQLFYPALYCMQTLCYRTYRQRYGRRQIMINIQGQTDRQTDGRTDTRHGCRRNMPRTRILLVNIRQARAGYTAWEGDCDFFRFDRSDSL